MYLIRLVRNPYEWGSGDLWSQRDDLDDTKAEVQRIRETTRLPDLNDNELWAKGYPGFTFVDVKVYKATEIRL